MRSIILIYFFLPMLLSVVTWDLLSYAHTGAVLPGQLASSQQPVPQCRCRWQIQLLFPTYNGDMYVGWVAKRFYRLTRAMWSRFDSTSGLALNFPLALQPTVYYSPWLYGHFILRVLEIWTINLKRFPAFCGFFGNNYLNADYINGCIALYSF